MKTLIENISELNSLMREKCPLLHNITNYVTVNDCANAQLAIGGSPIMSDDIGEVEHITSISSCLIINMGTLNERTVASMIASGKKANELGIPVVFDPVGAGASPFRNETVQKILKEVHISILRGNLSEISYIAGLDVITKGVDSSADSNKIHSISVGKNVAKLYNCVVAITGPVDIITDGCRVAKIHNGNALMSKVTGTGCMTSAMTGAYAGATNDYFLSAVAGVCTMGIAGDIAYEKASSLGTGSFHMAIIDAISKIDKTMIKERAKIHEE